MSRTGERRRSARYLCSQLVEVLWGGQHHAGLLEDLSPEGAAVGLETQIEQGETVRLLMSGIKASAVVRYCLVRETDYRLGLEFKDGFRWDSAEWRPEHCFLPPGDDL